MFGSIPEIVQRVEPSVVSVLTDVGEGSGVVWESGGRVVTNRHVVVPDSLPAVGELAVAIGNPLGFENTVTAGIVSGLHRSIPGSAAQSLALDRPAGGAVAMSIPPRRSGKSSTIERRQRPSPH